MTLFKGILIFYLVMFLVLANMLLLLCNDQQYCFIPVRNSSINSHLGFNLRQFSSQFTNDFVSLMVFANFVLYSEIIFLGVIVVKALKKYFWVLAQIIGLTWIILYVVFQWSQYRTGNIIGREGWVQVLSYLQNFGSFIALYFK